ncbi:hypothetical protein [Lancefieldella sp. Marseille-Q7238]|uniref:hypothetical protein n=1 Tax=Lancefieldella sp. Marseille-Q7238 TaxID=3022127 RepID=UPI0024A7EA0A|nr:hypothetical protein [Lancefieldella sp. Marseille-Q7238]
MANPGDPFARSNPGRYTTLAQEAARVMARRRMGADGWPVMLALCNRIYADGELGTYGREEISTFTGLTYRQIVRGMSELREKDIIAPVIRKVDGYCRLDHSIHGHVARYYICRDIFWALVELKETGDPPSDRIFASSLARNDCVSTSAAGVLAYWPGGQRTHP